MLSSPMFHRLGHKTYRVFYTIYRVPWGLGVMTHGWEFEYVRWFAD